MRCTEFDRRFKITAHAHAQAVQAVTLGNTGKQSKVFFRIFAHWGNAHQALNREGQFRAAILYEMIRRGNRYTSLLFFITRIDLNKQLGVPSLFHHFAGDRLCNARPVQCMNRVEQANSVGCLVGLQRTYQMQFNAYKFCFEAGPLASRFLHPVFTKFHLTILQNGHDFSRGECFADGNQCYVLRRPTHRMGRPFNSQANIPQGLVGS